MSFDNQQFRELITNVLTSVELYSEEAVELLMLTAAQESELGTYIKQVSGPALGVFQMEPATHNDIWINYLTSRKNLRMKVYKFAYGNLLQQLEWNLAYAIIMARIHYMRIEEPLPEPNKDDYIGNLARYWKKYWNTKLGRGTVEQALGSYYRLCQRNISILQR